MTMKSHHWLGILLIAVLLWVGYHMVTQHNAGSLLPAGLGTK